MSSPVTADVVVIGSGAGGMTMAGEALRRGRSVVLVEAGDLTGDPPGHHRCNDNPREDDLPKFAAVVEDALVYHAHASSGMAALPGAKTAHCVGGRMALWFNNCPDPHPSERNRAVPEREWPGLLARARGLLHVRAGARNDSERERRLIQRLRRRFTDLPHDRGVQPMPVAVERRAGSTRFAGGDDLLFAGATHSAGGLQLIAGSVARRVDHVNGHVRGIEVHPVGGGHATRVEGQAYVLGAGTIGTPQLLAASTVDAPGLGRYVMDHPLLGTRVALAEDLLDGVRRDDATFAVWVPFSPERPWHMQLSRTASLDDVQGYPAHRTADVFTFNPSLPRAENRLLFDRDTLDGFDLPQVQCEFALCQEDVHGVVRSLHDQFLVLNDIGATDRTWIPQLFPLGASTHLMGGCRMGTVDGESSVVDVNSAVWGYDNLYVVGNSVLSEPSACNPTLQTVALALRSADAIL